MFNKKNYIVIIVFF